MHVCYLQKEKKKNSIFYLERKRNIYPELFVQALERQNRQPVQTALVDIKL